MVRTMAARTAFSAHDRNHQSIPASGMAIIWAIVLAKLLFHTYFNNRYGYFRDEFDYISRGEPSFAARTRKQAHRRKR